MASRCPLPCRVGVEEQCLLPALIICHFRMLHSADKGWQINQGQLSVSHFCQLHPVDLSLGNCQKGNVRNPAKTRDNSHSFCQEQGHALPHGVEQSCGKCIHHSVHRDNKPLAWSIMLADDNKCHLMKANPKQQ